MSKQKLQPISVNGLTFQIIICTYSMNGDKVCACYVYCTLKFCEGFVHLHIYNIFIYNNYMNIGVAAVKVTISAIDRDISS